MPHLNFKHQSHRKLVDFGNRFVYIVNRNGICNDAFCNSSWIGWIGIRDGSGNGIRDGSGNGIRDGSGNGIRDSMVTGSRTVVVTGSGTWL